MDLEYRSEQSSRVGESGGRSRRKLQDQFHGACCPDLPQLDLAAKRARVYSRFPLRQRHAAGGEVGGHPAKRVFRKVNTVTVWQIMNEIKAMTPEERDQIALFLRRLESGEGDITADKRADEISDRILERHAVLMRKLAL